MFSSGSFKSERGRPTRGAKDRDRKSSSELREEREKMKSDGESVESSPLSNFERELEICFSKTSGEQPSRAGLSLSFFSSPPSWKPPYAREAHTTK